MGARAKERALDWKRTKINDISTCIYIAYRIIHIYFVSFRFVLPLKLLSFDSLLLLLLLLCRRCRCYPCRHWHFFYVSISAPGKVVIRFLFRLNYRVRLTIKKTVCGLENERKIPKVVFGCVCENGLRGLDRKDTILGIFWLFRNERDPKARRTIQMRWTIRTSEEGKKHTRRERENEKEKKPITATTEK